MEKGLMRTVFYHYGACKPLPCYVFGNKEVYLYAVKNEEPKNSYTVYLTHDKNPGDGFEKANFALTFETIDAVKSVRDLLSKIIKKEKQ